MCEIKKSREVFRFTGFFCSKKAAAHFNYMRQPRTILNFAFSITMPIQSAFLSRLIGSVQAFFHAASVLPRRSGEHIAKPQTL